MRVAVLIRKQRALRRSLHRNKLLRAQKHLRGYLGHKGWWATKLIWLGKPNHSKRIKCTICWMFWSRLGGWGVCGGNRGGHCYPNHRKERCPPKACKQNDVKRPQGWARDGAKVIVLGPLRKRLVLIFLWWSRAPQQGVEGEVFLLQVKVGWGEGLLFEGDEICVEAKSPSVIKSH